MKCEYCGCTDGRGCLNGCSWILPGVCSNCVVNVTNVSRELLAYIKDPDVKKIEVLIIDKDNAVSKLRVISLNQKYMSAYDKKHRGK